MEIMNSRPSRNRGDTVRDKRHGPTRPCRAPPRQRSGPLAVVLGWSFTMDRLYRPESLAWREECRVGCVVVRTAPSRWRAVPIVLFALFWNVFVIGLAIASRGAMLIIGWLHLSVGAVLLYQGLFRLLGTSRFTLGGRGF